MGVTKDTIRSTYPLPTYNYMVTLGSETIAFSEVSGLAVEYETLTYKHGFSYLTGWNLIRGMERPINITMKKGLVKGKSKLRDVFFADPKIIVTIDLNSILFGSPKEDITVNLCNENGTALVQWKVVNALPVKIDAPTFDANTYDVAIESIELTAQGLRTDYSP